MLRSSLGVSVRRALVGAFLLGVGGLVAACSGDDMYSGGNANDALRAIEQKTGKSRTLWSVHVFPKSVSAVTMEPTEEWELVNGKVVGPTPTEITGSGDKGPRFQFEIGSVDLKVVPRLVQYGQEKTKQAPRELRLWVESPGAPPRWGILFEGAAPLSARLDGTPED